MGGIYLHQVLTKHFPWLLPKTFALCSLLGGLWKKPSRSNDVPLRPFSPSKKTINCSGNIQPHSSNSRPGRYPEKSPSYSFRTIIFLAPGFPWEPCPSKTNRSALVGQRVSNSFDRNSMVGSNYYRCYLSGSV